MAPTCVDKPSGSKKLEAQSAWAISGAQRGRIQYISQQSGCIRESEACACQDLVNTGFPQKEKIADKSLLGTSGLNSDTTICAKAAAASKIKLEGGAVYSKNGTLRREERRPCLRYAGKFHFIEYQNVDLFFYGADLDTHLPWSSDWASSPSLYRTQYRLSPGLPDLDHFVENRPSWATFNPIYGNKHRSSLGLFDLDPRTVDQPHFRLDLDAQPLNKGMQKPQNNISALDLLNARVGPPAKGYQVFIKLLEGKSKLIWVKGTDTVKQMQEIIMQQLGYPIKSQNLIHGGRALQDTKFLWEYQIEPLSTIMLNLRIRGGASVNGRNNNRAEGSGTSSGKKPGSISFKNILQGKNTKGTAPNQIGMDAGPYIVDQLDHTPEYNIDTPEIEEHCTTYERQAIICRFNSFWPKPMDLFHWIFTNWTMQCEIHLCSRTIDRDTVLQEGP